MYIQSECSAINEHAVIEVYELIIYYFFFYGPEEFIFRSWYDLRRHRRPPREREFGYAVIDHNIIYI